MATFQIGDTVRRTSGDRRHVGTVIAISGAEVRVQWHGSTPRFNGNADIHSWIKVRSLVKIVPGEVYRPFVATRPRYDASGYICPTCGAKLCIYRQARGPKSGRSHSFHANNTYYSCPVADSEVYADERGHLHREANAKHDRVRVWSVWELERQGQHAACPIGDDESVPVIGGR